MLKHNMVTKPSFKNSFKLTASKTIARQRSWAHVFQFNKGHFLDGTELNALELRALLDLAKTLKAERKAGLLRSDLLGKNLILVFDKASLRTRLSFTTAMRELGGEVIETQSSSRKHEEPKDFIRVLNGYAHVVMVRTFEHSIVEEMSQYAIMPIINGLTDSHHPCQGLADFLTLEEIWGDLRGKTLSYVGDGNNVLHSLMVFAPLLGMNVKVACPQGYTPEKNIWEKCLKRAQDFGTELKLFEDPKEAVVGAHAIYTDVWTSMGFEDENETRMKAFAGYQVNKELHALADHKAVIMHCLPMVRGLEISDEMADHPQSVIFNQSENRLHAQKALLLAMLNSGARM